jgi:hypothetical protein
VHGDEDLCNCQDNQKPANQTLYFHSPYLLTTIRIEISNCLDTLREIKFHKLKKAKGK